MTRVFEHADDRDHAIMTTEDVLHHIKQSADNTDLNGISDQNIRAMQSVGMFSPQPYPELMEMARKVAYHCGASGMLAISFSQSRGAVQDMDVLEDNDLVAPALFHDKAFVRSEGGMFVIDGTWPAVGGVQHASLIFLQGLTLNDQPVSALIRSEDATITQKAYFGGLRGAGWAQVDVQGLKVEKTAIRPQASSDRLTGIAMLGALMGVAEAAYDDYVQSTRKRVAGIGGASVAQFTQVQSRVAESDVEMKAVRLLYGNLRASIGSNALSDESFVELIRDGAYIARQLVESIGRLHKQMGAMGLSEKNTVQRRFRDMRALESLADLDWNSAMAKFGRKELGISEVAA